MDDKFVTLLTFTHPIEAAVIQSKLESEGIECFLRNEYSINTNPFNSNALGGAELQIKESDLEKAREIMGAGYNFQPIEPDPDGNEGRIICPVCGADQADRKAYKILVFILSIFMLGIPLFYMGRKRHCYKCGYVFPQDKVGTK
jgi:hypothetical protein